MNFPVYIMATRNLGMNLIRGIFVTLDIMVFQVFQWVTQAVFDLTTLEIVKEEAYQAFQERIYVILGIFMLFKIAISLLNYLVSPDKISDKEQGMGKLFMRVIISLCMLVAAPSFFNFLSRVQGPLLNAVPRIILGTATSVESTTNSMGTMASDIAWTTYGVVLDQENLDGSDLIQGWDDLPAKINDPGEDNSVYKYTYRPVLGILIGAVMSFLMLAICLDIAIRVFKLAILRMLAPIPILSYIDPKSSKDGMFQNYMKTLMSTWLDVFIKIGVLFFVISMIEIVVLEGNASLPINNLPGIRGLVASIFIIIGLLFFARQFPQFVSSALGIKNSKGLGIGLGGALAAGGALVGGAGLAGAAMAGMTAMNENADAAAQGKAGTASWGKGRDLAAQLRTGDQNAKAGITNRLQDRMKIASSDRQARRLGLSAENVANLKQNMYNKKDELTAAQNKLQEYQAGVESGQYRYDSTVMESLQKNISTAALNAQKAETAYNDAKAGRESIVGKNGTRDDYASGMFGRGTYRARVNNPHRGERLGSDGETGGNWSRPKPNPTIYSDVKTQELADVELPLEQQNNNTTSQSGVHTDGGGRQPYSDQWDDE